MRTCKRCGGDWYLSRPGVERHGCNADGKNYERPAILPKREPGPHDESIFAFYKRCSKLGISAGD